MLYLVAQSCPTLCCPVDCNPPGSSVHGILQAGILEWVSMPSSRESSQPMDWTQVSFIAVGFFTIWVTREAPCTRSVQFSYSFMSDSFATPWTAACQPSLSITNSLNSLKLMSIESVMPSNHLILCCPLLLPPSIFPASGSFLRSQFFASGGQSIGVSASTSVLPMNIQDWFLLEWTGSRAFSNTTVQKHRFFWCSDFLIVPTLTSIHDHWKNHSLD